MTLQTAESPGHLNRPAGPRRRVSAFLASSRAVWVIALLQAVWLTWCYGRGWFLQADLSNMVEAVGRNPDWGYLSGNLGGHFSPLTRFVYWAMVQTSPLNYGVAVGLRIVFQFAATVLLHRILLELTRNRTLVNVIVALYAVNPMLVAGTAMFTPGITIQVGQLLFLLALAAHLRYESSGSLRYALAAGVLLGLAILSSEQWVVAAAVLPLVSLLHFYDGNLAVRLRTLLRHWRSWLLELLPYAAAVVGAATLAVPVGAAPPGLSDSLNLLRRSWLDSVGPSLIGGPFNWYSTPTNYLGFSAPSAAVIVIGQIGILGVVVVGLERRGPASLLAWLIPLVCWSASMALVGYRGYADYQLLVAITPRYLAALVVIFAIGAALALAPQKPASDAPTADDHRTATDDEAADPTPTTVESSEERPPPDRAGLLVISFVVATILIASLVSGASYAARFARLPAASYVDNLTRSARLSDSVPNVYDTAVPIWLITGYEPHHRVSDLLRLADVPHTVNARTSIPLLADRTGRLRKSVFLGAARVTPGPGSCGTLVKGAGTTVFALDKHLDRTEWWLNLVLFQYRPSTVWIWLVAPSGELQAPVGGPRIHLEMLEWLSLRLPLAAPRAIQITTEDPSTALCLTTIQVGAPFPTGPR